MERWCTQLRRGSTASSSKRRPQSPAASIAQPGAAGPHGAGASAPPSPRPRQYRGARAAPGGGRARPPRVTSQGGSELTGPRPADRLRLTPPPRPQDGAHRPAGPGGRGRGPSRRVPRRSRRAELRALRRRAPRVRHHPSRHADCRGSTTSGTEEYFGFDLEHRGRLLVLPRRAPAPPDPLPVQQRALPTSAGGTSTSATTPPATSGRRRGSRHGASSTTTSAGTGSPTRRIASSCGRGARRDALLRPPRRGPRGLAAAR